MIDEKIILNFYKSIGALKAVVHQIHTLRDNENLTLLTRCVMDDALQETINFLLKYVRLLKESDEENILSFYNAIGGLRRITHCIDGLGNNETISLHNRCVIGKVLDETIYFLVEYVKGLEETNDGYTKTIGD